MSLSPSSPKYIPPSELFPESILIPELALPSITNSSAETCADAPLSAVLI